MNAGDTFILTQLDCHLWVIISDPSQDSENVVFVNLTTHTLDEEDCCIVEKDEHPFVKHKTAVRYKDGRIASTSELRQLEKADLLNMHKPVTSDLLDRIRKGAADSDYLPGMCRSILDKQGLF